VTTGGAAGGGALPLPKQPPTLRAAMAATMISTPCFMADSPLFDNVSLHAPGYQLMAEMVSAEKS
jgi:hypothetical protein